MPILRRAIITTRGEALPEDISREVVIIIVIKINFGNGFFEDPIAVAGYTTIGRKPIGTGLLFEL